MSGAGDHASPLGDADEHIGGSTLDRLIYMANQMDRFFASQKHEAAVAGLAEHIAKFWDPRMKAMILAHGRERGGEGLSPLALEAVRALHDQQHAHEVAAAAVGRPGEDEA